MSTARGGAQAHLARPRWAERKFAFVHPPWMLADFLERLRGVVPRLGPFLNGVSHEFAHRHVDGTWSIAQNVGHLSDVEDLWQERLDDLRRGRERYTPADPVRFQAAAARHEGRPLTAIVEELATRRRALVAAMESAPPALHLASAFHERLQCPMRLVDCAQFYAEHDDHHLLRIRALRTTFGLA
ncbi:MAG TPA: DinB family protein [Candidatus Eisenbacteria bacterium]|nr:DinB family protein [Candidatus Eisenbacteria bacterium]